MIITLNFTLTHVCRMEYHNPYHLDESTFILRVIGSNFSLFDENYVSK